MNRGGIVLAALITASAAGCAPSLESKLIGRWRVNLEDVDFQQLAAEQAKQEGEAAGAMAAMAAGMMETMFKNMQIETEFRPDHTMSTKVALSIFGQSQEKTQTGTWKVESTGDDALSVAVTMDDGKTNTMNIHFLDDNTFTAAAPLPTGGEQQVKFERITESGE
ncbi:MAG: hypothetical protein KY475_14710 [Planctomycetes bacterium]|nr:hypothetical protein [Planctomycetota bacterium]